MSSERYRERLSICPHRTFVLFDRSLGLHSSLAFPGLRSVPTDPHSRLSGESPSARTRPGLLNWCHGQSFNGRTEHSSCLLLNLRCAQSSVDCRFEICGCLASLVFPGLITLLFSRMIVPILCILYK